MKVARKLTPLIMALAMISCNEQVSPKLQDANSSSVVPPTITPTEYYFKVQDTSALIQNYKLHRSGAANATTPCEVRKTIPLTNDLFISGDIDSDITCFFEAEELSLFHGGFSFEFESSPNTCEYIAYKPFSFYNRIPGSSSASLTQVICETDTVAPTHIDSVGGTAVDIAGGGTVGCDQYVDNNFSPALRGSFGVDSDEALCRFNYQDGNLEQCDEGVISVNELKVTHTPADADAGTPEVVQATWGSRTVRCGGKYYNCVGGPIRSETGSTALKAANYSIIYQTVKNETFTQSREYAPISNSFNMHYSNFRRFLANPAINFFSPLSANYEAAFAGATDYQGDVMESYSKNVLMDGITQIITPTEQTDAAVVYVSGRPTYRALKYAADPFLGLKARTSPFYEFTCLDRAYETKARIRMVVRDWDRVYTGDVTERELISDVDRGYNARQDNEYFLNLLDWDDYIPMSRTPGPYAPATTEWGPVDEAFAASLFFSPLIFPAFEE